MAAQFSDFLPLLGNQVSGVPVPVAKRALRDSAILFCEQTEILQVVTDPQTLVVGESEYTLTLPIGTEIARIQDVWVGRWPMALSGPIEIRTPLAYNNPIGPTSSGDGFPRNAFESGPTLISLYPAPDTNAANEKLTVRVSIKPSRDCTSLEDVLLDDWMEAVVAGAVMRLATQPGQAWTNGDAATIAAGIYRMYVSRARIQATKGKVTSNIQVVMRPFA